MATEKDLFKRLHNLELSELKSNSTVQEILQDAGSRCVEIEFCKKQLKLVAAFPRNVRHFYEQQRIKKEAGEPKTTIETERDGYNVAASLCIESPFNSPSFWEYYDTQTGMFWADFNRIYAAVEKSEADIAEFRQV